MKAADVMVRNVGPDACVQDVAHVLLTARPIVDGGKVVGIVSRANLLQALASLSKRAEVATRVDDSQIRDKVLTQLNAEPWTRPSLINVIVQDGTVELWGSWTRRRRRKLSASPPRSPPGCAPSMTI